MSKYSNLPGVEVSIANGGLILPEDASTESMLILAPSSREGAPTEPVLIRRSSDLEALFGNFTDGTGVVNPIAAAWKAAFEGGNRRIYLMALEGATDGERYSNMKDAFEGILADFPVDHVVAHGVYADQTITDVAHEAVGSATIEPSIEITAANDTLAFTDGTNVEEITIDAGIYTAQELITALNLEIDATATYSDVEASLDSESHIVLKRATAFELGATTTLAGLPVGASTGVDGDFATLVADFAHTQTLNLNSCIGYIGVSAPTTNGLADVNTHVTALVARDNSYSEYVQIVAGPELGYQIPGSNELHYMNGAVTYAALVSTLRPESAPTNKRVYGIAGIHYTLSLRQLNKLTGNKYVTFRLKGDQVVVTDGVTSAPDYQLGQQVRSSDYARLSTLRVTQAAAQLVREVCEPFIGEPNRMPQYNSLNASIKAGLEAMKAQGAISDYRFTVTASGASLNEAVVTLELVPAFELRKVSVNVSLRPNFLN